MEEIFPPLAGNESEKLKKPDDFVSFTLQYQQMIMLYESAVKCVTMQLDILEQECRSQGRHTPIHLVSSRIKQPMSINAKMKRKGLPITVDAIMQNLNDVAGVRIICEYISDVYAVRDLLKNSGLLEIVQEKDYIARPKPNGYRSLHLIVNVPVLLTAGVEKVRCEIQLRTSAMDSWASLEHHIRYKSGNRCDASTNAELSRCADMLYQTDLCLQEVVSSLHLTE